VSPGNTIRRATRLREVEAAVTARLYSRVGHRWLIAAFGESLSWIAPGRRDVLGSVTTGADAAA